MLAVKRTPIVPQCSFELKYSMFFFGAVDKRFIYEEHEGNEGKPFNAI